MSSVPSTFHAECAEDALAQKRLAASVQGPIAPWWHTTFVLLVLGAGSMAGAYEHGLPHLHLPGMGVRVSAYVTGLVEEWFLVLCIWIWLRKSGLPLAALTCGRWQRMRTFWNDLGWASGFLLVGLPLTSALSAVVKAKLDTGQFLPHSASEMAAWLLLAATAGFAEELIFRGYLQRQFKGWIGSTTGGVVLQGVVFGLAHGYQGRFMMVIIFYGCLFGAFMAWRKSLLPAMLAHGMQDAAAGLVFFLSPR